MVFADTDHHFGKHTHEQFGVGLILRGAQKSASQCGVVEATAGDIITVNPEEVHEVPPWGRVAAHGRCSILTWQWCKRLSPI